MKKIYYGWWIVLASFLMALYVGGGVFFGLTAFFTPIVEEFGWSYSQVSIAFSLRGLEMGILAPLIGFLINRFGWGKLSFLGVIVVGFAMILLSLTRSLPMFYAAFALLALGGGGCTPTLLMTVVAHWFRKDVGKAMGLLSCGFGGGGILIPLIVWLIDSFHWRSALVILGIGTWAIGIPLSLVIRKRPEQLGFYPDGGAQAPSKVSDPGREPVEIRFADAVKDGGFWKIALAEGIRSMIVMAVVTHVMPYLASIGMSRPGAALVATCLPVLSLFGRLTFGWLCDLYDKRYIFAVTFCLLGTGTLLFSYVEARWLIVPFLILFTSGFGGTVPLRGAILREYFDKSAFGRLLGIVMGTGALGGMIGTYTAGWTFDHYGSYRAIWTFFSAAAVAAIVLVLRIRVRSPIREETRVNIAGGKA